MELPSIEMIALIRLTDDIILLGQRSPTLFLTAWRWNTNKDEATAITYTSLTCQVLCSFPFIKPKNGPRHEESGTGNNTILYNFFTGLKSCSDLKTMNFTAESGNYVIDPDGEGGLPPFNVTCDMNDKNGVGLTVISHDSESRTLVDGYEEAGSYSRDIHYTGASLSQLASLTTVSSYCEQFIKYECYSSGFWFSDSNPDGWWVSRDSAKMTYWGGASVSGKCACGMTNSCADPRDDCNCDKNDNVWREDSGLLTDKSQLPVKQLRFGDTGNHYGDEKGYHTLGKLKCYGTA